MKTQILQYVHNRDRATFAELSRDIPGFKGDLKMTLDGFETIILWVQLSADAIDALNDLLEEKSLFMIPTVPLTYLADGERLTYPVVKSPRRYREPRWLPVVFTHKDPELLTKRRK